MEIEFDMNFNVGNNPNNKVPYKDFSQYYFKKPKF